MRKLSNSEWVKLTSKFTARYKEGERVGEAYMNALSELDAELYDDIKGTSADCYDNDNKVTTFIRSLNLGYITVMCRWCHSYFKTKGASLLGTYHKSNERLPEEHWICHECSINYAIINDEDYE